MEQSCPKVDARYVSGDVISRFPVGERGSRTGGELERTFVDGVRCL